MAKKSIISKEVPKDVGVYIDPRTDFGFKRLFGDKELMIDFLNSVLDVKDGIVELQYRNTVRTGLSKDDRTAIYDLYCTTGSGEHTSYFVQSTSIIVEMQTIPHENYIERIVYYISCLIQQLGKKGKDWDFGLPAVYSVIIVDFMLDKEKVTEKYLSKIKLLNCETKELFYDKLTLMFLELPRFTKKVDVLETNVEKWVYALKNLPKLDRMPSKLRAKIFNKLFELAKIAKLTSEQQNNYYKSLNDMGIIKIQFGKMEKTIATQDKTIAAQAKRIAELERRLGLNDASAQKTSTRKAKPRKTAGEW